MPQVNYTTHKYSSKPISEVFYFENIQEDILTISQKCGANQKLNLRNKSTKEYDQRDLSENFLSIIVDHYREDYETFNYNPIQAIEKYCRWLFHTSAITDKYNSW